MTKTVWQQRLLGFQTIFFQPRLQETLCALGDWEYSLLPPLTYKANGVALVLSHIGNAQMRDLGNPCACVIEQLKEETIAAASPAGGRGSLQDRLDLGFGKEPNQRPFPALSGNGQDRLQLRGLIDRIKRQEIPAKVRKALKRVLRLRALLCRSFSK